MRDVSYETELINQNQREEKKKILFEFKNTHDFTLFIPRYKMEKTFGYL